jgi:hypothetical protein
MKQQMTFQAWREQALEEERRALNKAIKAMTQIGILWKRYSFI